MAPPKYRSTGLLWRANSGRAMGEVRLAHASSYSALCIADIADNPLASLQAASSNYRIALEPRAGQKVLSLRTVAGRDEKTTAALCADAHEFIPRAGVRCRAHQRKELECLCRYITPAIVNERQLWRKSTVSNGSGGASRGARKQTFAIPETGPSSSDQVAAITHKVTESRAGLDRPKAPAVSL